MTDEPIDGPDEPAPDPFGREAPPPLPADEAIFAGGFGSSAPSPARRRPIAYLAIVIGLVAMVGGAIFFARSAGQASGAKTPEAAVQRVFDALGNEDFLGVLEALTPAERSLLNGRTQTVAQELGRLGILRKDLDLGKVKGIDLAFTGLQYQSTSLADGFTAVEIKAGTSTYRIDPATSPLGDFVRGLLSSKAAGVVSGSDDISRDHPVFMAVRQDGSWYVSIGYSMAEQARRDAGAAVPTFGSGVPGRGAATPEAAVDQFLRAAGALDVRRLIELTPPGEAGALHDYAPLFLPDLEKGAKEARSAFSLTIKSLKLSSQPSGDEAVVKIDTIAFRLTIPGAGVVVDFDGECATIKGAEGFLGLGSNGRLCGKDLARSSGIPGFELKPEAGIVAVREGEVWYVSPTRTVLDGLIAILKAIQPGDLERFKQFFGAFGFQGYGGPTPRSMQTTLPHA